MLFERAATIRSLATVAAALSALLTADAALAQPSPRPTRGQLLSLSRQLGGELGRLPRGGTQASESLRDRFAEPRGQELLTASSPEDRLRGIARLANHDSDRAVAALIDALQPGRLVRSWPQSRLAAVRALADRAAEEDVRERLIDILGGGDSNGDAVSELARATSALALARSGTVEAVRALLMYVLTGDRAGEYAREALLAHRPQDWAALNQELKQNLPVPLIELLGDLGDPRALGILRRIASGEAREESTKPTKPGKPATPATPGKPPKAAKPSAARSKPTVATTPKRPAATAAALIALAKLGDGHAARYARAYLKLSQQKQELPLQLKLAAVRALLLLDTPDAAKQVGTLMAATDTRQRGVALAEQSLLPELLPTLKAMLAADIELPDRTRAAHLVWRIGGPQATRILVPLLAQPELATAAAFGLSSIRDASAGRALDRALSGARQGAPRRLALRAQIARALRFGEADAALDEALKQTLQSSDSADRAVAAFGLAALSPKRGAELLQDKRPEVVIAAASALAQLGVETAALATALERAAKQHPDNPHEPLLVALSAALFEADTGVATSTLASWAQSGSALSAPASFRLARRDSRAFRQQTRALLDASDPLIRLHVAWGLAGSPERDATSLLAGRYLFEGDVRVRRAVLQALAARPEAQRSQSLELAAKLDPDPACRAIARLALNGPRAVTKIEHGRNVVWLTLRANGDDAQAVVVGRPALLVRDDGTAVPVVAAPDGVILAGGLPATRRMSLQLAPGGAKGEP